MSITIEVTTRDGRTKAVGATAGLSVMENLRGAGIEEILALCGGCCSCGTCQVYVDPAWLDRLEPISPLEDDVLDTTDIRRAESRLSCQIIMAPALDGLRVTVAPED